MALININFNQFIDRALTVFKRDRADIQDCRSGLIEPHTQKSQFGPGVVLHVPFDDTGARQHTPMHIDVKLRLFVSVHSNSFKFDPRPDHITFS